ncbi:hypothetical protein Pcinc_023117, partial [Petrolisthes cinctipes]
MQCSSVTGRRRRKMWKAVVVAVVGLALAPPECHPQTWAHPKTSHLVTGRHGHLWGRFPPVSLTDVTTASLLAPSPLVHDLARHDLSRPEISRPEAIRPDLARDLVRDLPPVVPHVAPAGSGAITTTQDLSHPTVPSASHQCRAGGQV